MSAPTLDHERRQALEARLSTRARLLRPDPEVVARALRRCVKHEATSRGSLDSIPAAAVRSTEDLGRFSADDLGARSATDDLHVATKVAAAPTVAESMVEVDDPVDEGPVKQNIIHAVIRKGKEKIRGLAPGSVVAGYRIEGILGVGGMGQVYRATQMSMGREVAFKVLAPRLSDNDGFRDRFIREARNAGRLQHPNLIAVHDVAETEGLLFFSMELVEGKSVKQLIKQEGCIDETRAMAIIRQTLEALAYAHKQGIVHRDIKPDNLMVTSSGQVKVADLGLSRLQEVDEDTSLTQSGTMMGTPYYMSPEQGRDAHVADHRTDIYAVGATLYHMVCGKVPFEGQTPMDVLVRAATTPLTFPEKDPPRKPMQVLIRALMAKKPEDRPETSADALALIDKDGTLTTTPAQVRMVTGEQGAYRGRKRGGVGTWLVALVIALVAIAAVVYGVLVLTAESRWQDRQDQVAQAAADGRFVQAVGLLDDYGASNPHRAADIQRIRAEVLEQWSAHSRDRLESQFEQLDDQLFERRFDDVRRSIQELRGDPSLLSPYVIERLNGIESRLPSPGSESGANNGFDASTWLALAESRPALPRMGDGPVPLTGTGFYRLTMPPADAGPIELRLTVATSGGAIVAPATGSRNGGLGVVVSDAAASVRRGKGGGPGAFLNALRGGRNAGGSLNQMGTELLAFKHDGTVSIDVSIEAGLVTLKEVGGAFTESVDLSGNGGVPLALRWRVDSGTASVDIALR